MGRIGLALGLLAGLAGCSGDDTWFGKGEGPPLPGERVSVMLLERELSADPSLANLPIELPPPLQVSELPRRRMQVRQLVRNRVTSRHAANLNPADGWPYQAMVRLIW